MSCHEHQRRSCFIAMLLWPAGGKQLDPAAAQPPSRDNCERLDACKKEGITWFCRKVCKGLLGFSVITFVRRDKNTHIIAYIVFIYYRSTQLLLTTTRARHYGCIPDMFAITAYIAMRISSLSISASLRVLCADHNPVCIFAGTTLFFVICIKGRGTDKCA